MGDWLSHFIKCDGQGQSAESSKPIGWRGRTAASHFFKKVRCGCGRKHAGWLFGSGSKVGVRA